MKVFPTINNIFHDVSVVEKKDLVVKVSVNNDTKFVIVNDLQCFLEQNSINLISFNEVNHKELVLLYYSPFYN